jgi:hypothetical protein
VNFIVFALLAVLGLSVPTIGQGTVVFRNRVAGIFDAPFVDLCYQEIGPGVIPGMTAQLFLVNGSTLTALTPTTTFLGTSGEASKYLKGVDVMVPGAIGGSVTLRLRVYTGDSYEAGHAGGYYGESADFTATPSIAPNPPANLSGLGNNPISVFLCPEPSTVVLSIFGLGLLGVRRFTSGRKTKSA